MYRDLAWDLFLHRFMPPGLEVASRRRARTLAAAVPPLAGIAFTFVLVGFIKGRSLMMIGPVVATAALLGALPVLRRRGPVVAAHLASAGTYLCLLNNVVLSGGFASPIFYWLVVVPPIAGLLGGLTVGVTWSSVVLATMGLLLGLDQAGHGPPVLFEAGTPRVVLYLDVLGIPLALSLTVRAFLRQQAIADAETAQAIARLQEEVRIRAEAERAARVADRAKSRFLSTVSHELRTPMNGVIGMAELLLSSELRPDQLEYATTLRTSADAMMAQVDGILDFSRFEEGAGTLERHPFDLWRCIEEVGRLEAAAADRKGLELVIDLDPAVPRRVHGDEARLRQMVAALVGNAVKFTRQGRVVLSLERDAHRVRVAVGDTGPGMSDEMKERAFEPLTMEDDAPDRAAGGLGMGLAYVAALARAMGGTVGVESAPGAGSRVWFSALLDPVEPQGAADRPAGTELRGLRIVVVDDDDAARAAVDRQLRALGAEVACFGSPTDALTALRAAAAAGRPAHVALIDLEMPALSGIELCIPLRGDRALSSVARVLMVPPGRPVPAPTAARAGVTAQIAKPVIGRDLWTTLAPLAGCEAVDPSHSSVG